MPTLRSRWFAVTYRRDKVRRDTPGDTPPEIISPVGYGQEYKLVPVFKFSPR